MSTNNVRTNINTGPFDPLLLTRGEGLVELFPTITIPWAHRKMQTNKQTNKQTNRLTPDRAFPSPPKKEKKTPNIFADRQAITSEAPLIVE